MDWAAKNNLAQGRELAACLILAVDPAHISVTKQYHLRLFRNGVKVATSPVPINGADLRAVGFPPI